MNLWSWTGTSIYLLCLDFVISPIEIENRRSSATKSGLAKISYWHKNLSFNYTRLEHRITYNRDVFSRIQKYKMQNNNTLKDFSSTVRTNRSRIDNKCKKTAVYTQVNGE